MTTINFSKNLKRLREEKGMSKSELARRIDVSDVTIGYWESGKNEPRMGKVELIADVLGVTTDDLLFESTTPRILPPLPKGAILTTARSQQVPLYGSIAAGIPLEMIKAEIYVEIPEQVADAYPNAFLLRVNGDSMNKIVPHGAYALIDPCEELTNGDVAAIAVNGYDATLKRFYKLHNTIVLEPDSYNPEHNAKTFDCNSNECETINIIGKLVWFMSPFNIKY